MPQGFGVLGDKARHLGQLRPRIKLAPLVRLVLLLPLARVLVVDQAAIHERMQAVVCVRTPSGLEKNQPQRKYPLHGHEGDRGCLRASQRTSDPTEPRHLWTPSTF